MDSEISRQEFRALGELGRALWADPKESGRAATQAYAASVLRATAQQAKSTQPFSEELALERAARAMLERAQGEGADNTARNARIPGVISQPFYRLAPAERFLVTALQHGHWSYARLGRIFGASIEEIERTVWRARVELAGGRYPAGAKLSGANCPEYDAQRPWTQKFLDDEYSSTRDRMFLQNHLMACDSCRAALMRARELIATVESRLPPLEPAQDAQAELARLARESLVLRKPFERTLWESLVVFSRRWDARAGFAVLAAIGLIELVRFIRAIF